MKLACGDLLPPLSPLVRGRQQLTNPSSVVISPTYFLRDSDKRNAAAQKEVRSALHPAAASGGGLSVRKEGRLARATTTQTLTLSHTRFLWLCSTLLQETGKKEKPRERAEEGNLQR